MRVKEVIKKLQAFNPEAKMDVIVYNREEDFTITAGGNKDGEGTTKEKTTGVHFYVDRLCQNETSTKQPVTNVAEQFEEKYGSIALLKAAISAINRTLVDEAVISVDELHLNGINAMKIYEQVHLTDELSNTESGWLIELFDSDGNSKHRALALVEDQWQELTFDHALRFARKCDAEAYAKVATLDSGEWKAVEHQWIKPTSIQPL